MPLLRLGKLRHGKGTKLNASHSGSSEVETLPAVRFCRCSSSLVSLHQGSSGSALLTLGPECSRSWGRSWAPWGVEQHCWLHPGSLGGQTCPR